MYTYGRLCDDVAYLRFSGVDAGVFGKSECGLSLFYVHAGDYSGKQIIVTGGIHARENVSSLLVARQAFYSSFCKEEINGGVYFLPMLNPDGAVLIEKGADFLRGEDKSRADLAEKILLGEGLTDFSLWKANANGVDLNNNFDALFGNGEGQKTAPSSHGYPGEFPFSQSETAALKKFTLSVQPSLTLSYHALGREVYYNFHQRGRELKRDKKIAEFAARELNYKLIDSHLNSTGGYKDWCVNALRIPALTVEIISDSHSHPLSDEVIEEDYDTNKNLPIKLLNFIQSC